MSLLIAPTMALRLLIPWSLPPHGRLSRFQAVVG
jgi:hypothetical protein